MSLQSDIWIKKMSSLGMINPFFVRPIKKHNEKKIISYGLSSYGYDIRCNNEFKIFDQLLDDGGKFMVSDLLFAAIRFQNVKFVFLIFIASDCYDLFQIVNGLKPTC